MLSPIPFSFFPFLAFRVFETSIFLCTILALSLNCILAHSYYPWANNLLKSVFKTSVLLWSQMYKVFCLALLLVVLVLSSCLLISFYVKVLFSFLLLSYQIPFALTFYSTQFLGAHLPPLCLVAAQESFLFLRFLISS